MFSLQAAFIQEAANIALKDTFEQLLPKTTHGRLFTRKCLTRARARAQQSVLQLFLETFHFVGVKRERDTFRPLCFAGRGGDNGYIVRTIAISLFNL